jgi:TPR repeat protein
LYTLDLGNNLHLALMEGDYSGKENLVEIIPPVTYFEELKEQIKDGIGEAFLTLGEYCENSASFCISSSENRMLKTHIVPEYAFAYYKQAAQMGLAEGHYRVGIFYNKGYGITRCLDKAEFHYDKAANLDHTLAMFNQGVLNLNKNKPEAIKVGLGLWEKAAVKKDPVAIFNIGNLFRYGQYGYPQDDFECFQAYEKAAELGHLEAKYELGIMHREGITVEPNDKVALNYFRECAQEGMADAIYILAVYATNQGDTATAFNYFLNAAEKGHPNSQFNVARHYAYGDGIEADLFAAYFWARTLEKNQPDDQGARDLLNLIKDNLTKEEIDQIEQSINL